MTSIEKNITEKKAKIFKALGHPTRLWMVERLKPKELCVCEFVKEINADFSTISKHLSILKEAGIVEDEKRGKQVFYRLKVPCILKFIHCVEGIIASELHEKEILLRNFSSKHENN